MGGVNSIAASPKMLRRSAPQHKLRRVYPERSEGSPVAHQGSNQVSWAGSTASLHHQRCFVAPLLSINFEEFILSEAKDLRWHTKDLTRCHGLGQQHRCITGDASSLRSSA